MRYLVAFLGLMLASAQVQACRDPESWDTVFFEAIPNLQSNADVIAKVSLSDVNEEVNTATVTAIATVIQVLKTSDARIHAGDKIAMKYRFTSCGPDHKKGEEGMIIAKSGGDINGRLMLYPYVHNHRGRITPPSLSE